MSVVIDWKKVWDDFDKWYNQKIKQHTCNMCNSNRYDKPEWDQQEVKIQRLVNAQLKELSKKEVS